MRPLPLLLSALVGAGLLVTAPAGAATRDVWTVPSDATIGIRGHGYGHGHGMSQYGAEGAARQGLGAREIVDFYYPGTTRGEAKGRIAVLLTAATSDDLVVDARRGLVVRDTAGGPPLELPTNGASRWMLRETAPGVTSVLYRTNRWHRWQTLDGDGQFAAGGEPVTLLTPAGERGYRGRLRLTATSSGDLVTVNVVSLEAYLQGVVPLEIPASWQPAAVQAQAIAARTYAAYARAHASATAYDICDTTSCQVYGGHVAEHPASNAAIEATRHEVLLSGGQPAFTQFGSSSGGWTSAGSVPYLPAQRDPYDAWAGNPVHTWSTSVDDGVLERAWPAVGNLQRIRVTRRDGNGQWGGRVATMTLSGTGGSVTVSGDTFRSVLGLRSTWLTFSVRR